MHCCARSSSDDEATNRPLSWYELSDEWRSTHSSSSGGNRSIERWRDDSSAPSSQFGALSREFARQSAFLYAFLSNMSSPQQSPHLAMLLLRLNFNNWMSSRIGDRGGA